MKFELFIASRLKIGNSADNGHSSVSLNFASAGIILAIMVMVLSLTIIFGFKDEITRKIYALDAHIRITNAGVGVDDNISTLQISDINQALSGRDSLLSLCSSISLIAEKPVVLKTGDDFMGIIYRGADENFNWQFYSDILTEGALPAIGTASDTINEILISKSTAGKLNLHAGDNVMAYFVEDQVKVRKLHISGVFNSDFDDFDEAYILGNIAQIQNVNGWQPGTGTYVNVSATDMKRVPSLSHDLFTALAQYSCTQPEFTTIYNVTNTHRNNLSYFVWLNLLDMNVIIILLIMSAVSGFTLVAALLMIIIERIRMIGQLKALGATDSIIRRIFIFLTHKLIFKAIVLGNILGIGLSWAQQQFHIIGLDSQYYYMSYVPIHFNWLAIVMLNVAILILSYATLIGPSFIIAKISPATSLRYE